jgi:DNA-binding XRE family transcriptional regulator
MAAERKLDDEAVARLRELSEDGWTHEDLATVFGVTRNTSGACVRVASVR